MTRVHRCALLVAAFCVLGSAQSKQPVALSKITEIWADKNFETTDVLNLIDNVGTDFELSEANLSSLIDAARQGGRSPQEVSKVVFRLLKECRTCRTQLWGPVGKEELLALLKKGSPFAFDEMKTRGAKPFPASTRAIDELKAAGARPDLLTAVEERIVLPLQDGYRLVALQRTVDFNPQSMEGKLWLHVEVDEETEFVFRHNALSYHAITGGDPKDLGSSYSAFGPKFDEAQIEWKLEQMKPKAKRLVKGKPQESSAKFVADPSGRNGFEITINDTEKGRHEYELVVSWKPKRFGQRL